MNPNNELDRQRLMKAIENSTILPHHRAAGKGKHIEATSHQLTKTQHEVLG
jgi:hypothetical protein